MEQVPIAIQGCIEARLEHAFGLRRWSPKLEDSQRTDLREDANHKGKKIFARSRRLVILTPAFLITRPRKIKEELLLCHAGLVVHDFISLKAPGDARRFGDQLADVAAVRTEHFVLIIENVL